nr:unnamed protein product [Digitaria exilis]
MDSISQPQGTPAVASRCAGADADAAEARMGRAVTAGSAQRRPELRVERGGGGGGHGGNAKLAWSVCGCWAGLIRLRLAWLIPPWVVVG